MIVRTVVVMIGCVVVGVTGCVVVGLTGFAVVGVTGCMVVGMTIFPVMVAVPVSVNVCRADAFQRPRLPRVDGFLDGPGTATIYLDSPVLEPGDSTPSDVTDQDYLGARLGEGAWGWTRPAVVVTPVFDCLDRPRFRVDDGEHRSPAEVHFDRGVEATFVRCRQANFHPILLRLLSMVNLSLQRGSKRKRNFFSHTGW